MNPSKEFYICLVTSVAAPGDDPEFKFMHAVIASSEDKARRDAIAAARQKSLEGAGGPLQINSYWFNRSILEQAAREILGWEPPSLRNEELSDV